NGFGRIVVFGCAGSDTGGRLGFVSRSGLAFSSPGRAFTCSALQRSVGGAPQIFFSAAHPTQWPSGPR
ncbi:hypothetical protein AB2C96_31890, partial [Pseudomonas aeruginosa]